MRDVRTTALQPGVLRGKVVMAQPVKKLTRHPLTRYWSPPVISDGFKTLAGMSHLYHECRSGCLHIAAPTDRLAERSVLRYPEPLNMFRSGCTGPLLLRRRGVARSAWICLCLFG
jgi:hypothetical protein